MKLNMMQKEVKSFKAALNGMVQFFTKERHAKFHFCSATVVIALGFYFNISNLEWLSTLMAIGLVICTEMLNSAIEKLGDIVSIERLLQMKIVKDIAAAAVLFASIIAIAIAVIVFFPKIV